MKHDMCDLLMKLNIQENIKNYQKAKSCLKEDKRILKKNVKNMGAGKLG
jgi:hypothetical protein